MDRSTIKAMKSYELLQIVEKMLREELPTNETCQWYIDLFENNESKHKYSMRVTFDYDHYVFTYFDGEDVDEFLAKIKEEIEFYKKKS